MKKLSLLLMAGVAFTAFTNVATSPKSGTPLSATLAGANEVPGPGDPDGMGYVNMTLNQGQGTITYDLNVNGIIPATGAHIHLGRAGQAGPIVVHLMPPADGSSSETVNVDPELIKAIRKNPELYYVNVHNPMYPAGALRGQLGK